MTRKINRRKRYVSQIPQETQPTPSTQSEHDNFIVKMFNKTNCFLNKHPYIIFMFPLMYEFYNSYKQEKVKE